MTTRYPHKQRIRNPALALQGAHGDKVDFKSGGIDSTIAELYHRLAIVVLHQFPQLA